jgi:transposase
MGGSASYLAGIRQDRDGPGAAPIGAHHRQPVGQDDRKRGPRGYDAGKKIKGRKRRILTDTQGLLVKVKAHPADIQDRDGARLLVKAAVKQCPRVSLVFADGGCQGKRVRWIQDTAGWRTEIVRKINGRRVVWVPPGVAPPIIPTGFQVLPRRWVVERTFAWIGRYRRFSKDYEQLGESVESLVYLAMTRLMLARLTA